MELETPADAWYVWVGVALVSVAVAGVALTLPPEPPPDADAAANTIDRVGTSEYPASATAEHEATYARIGTTQIALRNDGGTDHATVAFGPITPVAASSGASRQASEALLAGTEPAQLVSEHTEFDSEKALRDALREVRLTVDEDGSNWQRTDGRIQIRSVSIAGEWVILVGV